MNTFGFLHKSSCSVLSRNDSPHRLRKCPYFVHIPQISYSDNLVEPPKKPMPLMMGKSRIGQHFHIKHAKQKNLPYINEDIPNYTDIVKVLEVKDDTMERGYVMQLNERIAEHLRYGLLWEADGMYREMLRKKCRPSTMTYVCMTQCFIQQDRMQELVHMLRLSKKTRVPLTLASYNSAIGYFANVRCLARPVMQILTDMKALGVSPNVDTYNLVLQLFSNKKDVRIFKIFNVMRANGIQPDVNTYNILMEYHRANGDTQEMISLFQHMKFSDIKPNDTTYSLLLLNAGERKDTIRIVGLIESIKEEKVETQLTCNTAIKVWGKQGETKKMLITLENMKKMGIQPNENTFIWMMEGYFRKKDTNGIQKVYRMLTQFGVKPTEYLFERFIECLAKLGSTELVCFLFKEMKRKNVIPQDRTLTVLFTYLARKGEMDKLEGVVNDVGAMGIYPNARVRKSLRRYLPLDQVKLFFSQIKEQQ